jgi:hypothetical protein
MKNTNNISVKVITESEIRLDAFLTPQILGNFGTSDLASSGNTMMQIESFMEVNESKILFPLTIQTTNDIKNI